MRSIGIASAGEAFVSMEVPAPVAAADEFLVEVRACGVCGHDVLNRKGAFPQAGYPLVMGHEISGVVVEVGSAVRGFDIGDRVALMQRVVCGHCEHCRNGEDNRCRSGPGFYGEQLFGGNGRYVRATARNAIRLPDSITFEEGAILSCALGTGHHALFDRSRFLEANWVLVTGATGGVGIHAVQIANAYGKRVVAVTGSEEKADALRGYGAEEVIVSPELDFSGRVKEITGEGADIALEVLGTRSLGSSIRSMRRGGEVVAVGNVGNTAAPAEVNPAVLILKEVSLVGSGHGSLDNLARVAELVERGMVKPVIHSTYPVARAEEAHRAMESREALGRVVLTQ